MFVPAIILCVLMHNWCSMSKMSVVVLQGEIVAKSKSTVLISKVLNFTGKLYCEVVGVTRTSEKHNTSSSIKECFTCRFKHCIYHH